MTNSNLRTGDTVVVIAGKDKGKTGKITQSFEETGRVVVSGVNIVYKHKKARSQKEQAEIKKEEAAIDVSNVQIICPVCKKATRIAHKFDENGVKHRACKKCGAFIDGEKKSKSTKATKKESKADAEKTVAKKEQKAKTFKNEKKDNVLKAETKGVRGAKAMVDSATTKRRTPQAKTQGK